MSDSNDLIHRKVFAGAVCRRIFAACRMALLLAAGVISLQAQSSQEKPAVDPTPGTASASSAPGTVEGDPALLRRPPGTDKDATSVNIFTGIGTASAEGYKPLTGRQRWQYYFNQNFISVGAVLGPVLSAGLDQVNAQPPEWGGGVKGYSERLASRLGTGIVQGTAQSIGCAALGQEPRYIRSADPRFLHRIGHAFVFSLITYNNEGKKRIAFATLSSYYVSSIATDAWLPARYSALGDGVRDGNRQVILAGLVNQFQEFWPEIKRFILRKK